MSKIIITQAQADQLRAALANAAELEDPRYELHAYCSDYCAYGWELKRWIPEQYGWLWAVRAVELRPDRWVVYCFDLPPTWVAEIIRPYYMPLGALQALRQHKDAGMPA